MKPLITLECVIFLVMIRILMAWPQISIQNASQLTQRPSALLRSIRSSCTIAKYIEIAASEIRGRIALMPCLQTLPSSKPDPSRTWALMRLERISRSSSWVHSSYRLTFISNIIQTTGLVTRPWSMQSCRNARSRIMKCCLPPVRLTDILHTIFVAHSLYEYTILNALMNPSDCPWSAKIAVLLQGLTDLFFEVIILLRTV